MAAPAPKSSADGPGDPGQQGPPRGRRPRLIFNDQDYELVELVNEFRSVGKHKRPEQLRNLFDPALHPRGIKQLAANQERRIAYAVIRLLDTLEGDSAHDRIIALRALHDELFFGQQWALQTNTARVLLSTMKELVRETADYWRQVELAHEFFVATSGRPKVIRALLRKYHILEMSESWNQVAFDHHVHDAHTKGRKSPTHLIMDAWIKGIRELTIVYYYYWTPEAVAELAEAAAIMDMVVRPGLEVSARHNGKYVQLVWTPLGLERPQDFLAFLRKPEVQRFLDEGREVARAQAQSVLGLLRSFNESQLERLNREQGLDLPPLDEAEFLSYVGVGQPSLTHLADFLHARCVERAKALLEPLRARHRQAPPEEQRQIEKRLEELDRLMPDRLVDGYLDRSLHPSVPSLRAPRDGDDAPALLQLTPKELFERLRELRAGATLVLNPTYLTPADVLEILYIGQGAITHLEVFNLKDYRLKRNRHTRRIAEIRNVVNRGNPIALKRLLRETIAEVEAGDEPDKERQVAGLREILGDILQFASLYVKNPIHSQIGSDSIGRSQALFGMGLVVEETLPLRARREFARRPGTRERLPVRTETALHTVWTRRESPIRVLDWAMRAARLIPGLRDLGYTRRDSFEVLPNVTRLDETGHGNILTLGGIEQTPTNGITLRVPESRPPGFRWGLLNTHTKNLLKVLIGFIPAFLTFFLTKDWWVLAWLGAPIWFGITGLRNVLQSVLGGGGLGRSKLLTWKDLVSWSRIADSLLYTGFSVPLLDWLVKSLLLSRGFNVTTATAPVLLYSAMSLANGLYLFSHNTVRGLPRAAALGNLFRSLLAIPIAASASAGLEWLLVHVAGLGEEQALGQLQNWAAVITKAASDLVAGFIEGTADRNLNIRTRFRDYRTKLALLLEVHGQLEALYPDRDVLEMLESPKEFIRTVDGQAHDLETRQIICALDMMFFWMLQPRARPVFEMLLDGCNSEDRQIILRTQRLLERQRPISQMFLDNLVGKKFPAPLAFYLDKSPAYLADMRRLLEKYSA